MEKTGIKDILDKLQHLMNGYNYQVTLGLDVFDDCPSLSDFSIKLKAAYPDSRPEVTTPQETGIDDFWKVIDACLKFRGDRYAGLTLNRHQEKVLEKEQENYKSFVNRLITKRTMLYRYPDERGIPGYPVYWDYRFILLNENNSCIFLYGSASD